MLCFQLHSAAFDKYTAERLPPKPLPKPRLQPQPQQQPPLSPKHSLKKLRHVDQTQAQTQPQPQPESADYPGYSPSFHSAVLVMQRMLQRLRDVDEQISEVNTFPPSLSLLYLFISLFYFCHPFSVPCDLKTLVIIKYPDLQKGLKVNVSCICYILIIDFSLCNVKSDGEVSP